MEIGLRGCTGGDGIERRFGCAVVVIGGQWMTVMVLLMLLSWG